MTCPHCHEPVSPGAVYCGACGRRVLGWRGNPKGDSGRDAVVSLEETRKVPPDPRLLEAAGRDLSASRVMAPESHLLQVIRRGAELQETRPDPRLDGGLGEGPAARPAEFEPALASKSGLPPEDTAFLMEAALRSGRSRVTVLLLADACLLLVGLYLIVTWSLRSPHRNAPPPRMATQGYLSWEDDGQRGSIATGPVVVTSQEPVPRRAAARPEVPGSGERPGVSPPAPPAPPAPPEARPREVKPRESTPRENTPREVVSREALEAAERLRTLAARDRFLKEIPGKVRSHQREIRRCYQQVISLRKGVSGDVDVEFELSASGSVLRAKPGRNSTGSAILGSCVAGVFLKMRFSPPPGGPLVLRYPFRFTPQPR